MELPLLARQARSVRILVLWNACRGTSREEDARWAAEESARVRACGGVVRAKLHAVESAALRHPRRWDWCLELDVEDAPNRIMRDGACAEFLADLRLLGTQPTVLVLPERS